MTLGIILSFICFLRFGERGCKLLTGEENRYAKLLCVWTVVGVGSASTRCEVSLVVGKVGTAVGVKKGVQL